MDSLRKGLMRSWQATKPHFTISSGQQHCASLRVTAMASFMASVLHFPHCSASDRFKLCTAQLSPVWRSRSSARQKTPVALSSLCTPDSSRRLWMCGDPSRLTIVRLKAAQHTSVAKTPRPVPRPTSAHITRIPNIVPMPCMPPRLNERESWDLSCISTFCDMELHWG